MKHTLDIGTLEGKLLLFGGVYSNLEALKRFRELADAEGYAPEQILCTGDVVGYCANPEETVQLIRDWGIHVIAGNVEIQLREGEADCGCDFREGSRCDVFSRQWYPFAQSRLSPASIEWLKTLPDHLRFEWNNKKVVVVHGNYFETAGYVFASTPWEEKQKNFEAANADIVIGGHAGLPFSQQQNNKLWLNAGVIGMPANDGTTRVWYATMDATAAGKPVVQHHAFKYDNEAAAQKMHAENLPPEYALTLTNGLWDNCEILPEEETRLQGVALALESAKRTVLK